MFVHFPRWLTLALILAAGLGALTMLVRWIEPRLAFFPLAGEDVTPADANVPFQAETINTADGERLRLWHLVREAPLARVVYFHGNGGNLSMWSDVLVDLWREGFDVVGFDYRGYGLSSGHPSETGLYRDADAVLGFVHDRAPLGGVPVIYWGRSLGTPIAAYAASARPPDGIVLEAGFPSVRSVLETNPLMWLLSWISSYRFPTAQWMASVERPVLVLHGDRDSVIPYRLGQRLHAGLRGPKTFVTIAGGDHNDPAPMDRGTYWDHVRAFVVNLPIAR